MQPQITERALILIVGTIQFINIVDFMMVMPLGPDFAAALGIATSNIGLIGASYTVAAAIAALLAVPLLDRFDRRAILSIAMLGLAAGTAAGALASDMQTLIAARVLAGIFGGPATSVAIAMIIDQVPVERRGRALGAVMGAFSAAAVVGVPLALEAAHVGGWRMPFYGVAGAGIVVAIAARTLLPPMRGHMFAALQRPSWEFLSLFTRSRTLLAYTATALTSIATFLVIPNISAFVQFNLGFPREHLGTLYLFGGAASFFAMRAAGRFVDRLGSFRVSLTGTAIVLICLPTWFIWRPAALPIIVLFVMYMVGMSVRNIATTTLLTHVPDPHERAGFMSANSAVQHLGAAIGAGVSSLILVAADDGALLHMDIVVLAAMTCAAVLPPIIAQLQRRAAPAGAATR